MDFRNAPTLTLPLGVILSLLALGLALLGVISLIPASYLAGVSVQLTGLILTHARTNHSSKKKNRSSYVV